MIVEKTWTEKLDLVDPSELWLVTGAAGFIGSNLVSTLLKAGKNVRALDNFATGHRRNINFCVETAAQSVTGRFEFLQGDVRSLDDCKKAVNGASYILHQAGLGSVPRSILDPIATNEVNISGFLNVLDQARRQGVKGFVYAASSSTYGDSPTLPKIEDNIGNALSPYAVTKYVNELYASVFSRCYGFKATGLRYFNVFGPRQDPNGAYAAVIPKWIAAMIKNEDLVINGDGTTSRDFCFVENTVQANILAALADETIKAEIFNVAVGGQTTLNGLFEMLQKSLADCQIHYHKKPLHQEFRIGDVLHSQADISKAKKLLGYAPSHNVAQGIAAAMPWYIDYFTKDKLGVKLYNAS